jgi:hypothetical protein
VKGIISLDEMRAEKSDELANKFDGMTIQSHFLIGDPSLMIA